MRPRPDEHGAADAPHASAAASLSVKTGRPGISAARLHAALPQTQCTRCGFPDCRTYAQAIADGDADIDQCPPGGAEGIGRLAALLGRAPVVLNPAHGVEGPRSVAVIDENWCIGCTLCLDACPTDAILGSNKLMHTVIERYCTGCERCVPVCPVDCIGLENASGERTGWAAWSQPQADEALDRYLFHSYLRTQDVGGQPKQPQNPATGEAQDKSAVIEAVLNRARSKRTDP